MMNDNVNKYETNDTKINDISPESKAWKSANRAGLATVFGLLGSVAVLVIKGMLNNSDKIPQGTVIDDDTKIDLPGGHVFGKKVSDK